MGQRPKGILVNFVLFGTGTRTGSHGHPNTIHQKGTRRRAWRWRVRMKSMFAIGFCFTALMGMFNSIFDGRVVAKLPFTPLSYIQGLSHRNLLGDDTTDCSFIFLYILCTMSIRQNIQKILGLAPSRAATKQAGGFLGPPPPSGKFS